MGVRIAVDFGTVRVGVAKSDPAGKIALPLTTITGDELAVEKLVQLTTNEAAQVVYVGLPLNLKGQVTQSAKKALSFAEELSRKIAPIPVLMIDERFTSTTATKQLQDAGLTSRQSRGLVDQVSALGLLEQALQIEDRTGTLAGSPPADWDF
ncbi:MAG: Holliday junction resolvase RuvX [Candidatus Nanopelagicales bacterium]|jgi:putative Holliday junction resolvase